MSGPSAQETVAPSNKPRRGEIWEIDLNPRKGREQHGVRPCLVVSTDALNTSDFGTIIVFPITTRERPSFKWRTGILPRDLALAEPSWTAEPHWIATDQIVTVDARERALRHLATVRSGDRLREVDASLKLLLALR